MFKFNLYFKIVCSVILLLSLLVISSCIEQKKVSELDVKHSCKGAVCILGVVDKDFLRTKNILNQTQYTLLKTTPLKSNDPQDDGTHLLWSSKDGTLATQEELTNVDLGIQYPCPDGKCTVTSNPTGFVADHLGINTGHVKGYVTNSDGQKEYIDKDVSLNITVNPKAPKIKMKPLVSSSDGLTYELYIVGAGIPLDSTYEWYIDGDLISKDGSFIHTFKFKGDLYESHKIKVVITLNDKSIEPIILSSTIIPKPASISSKQEKGLLYSFTANTTNTGLPSEGVTYAWSVNGNSIGTGSNIAYLFPKANKRYTVSLETKIGAKVIGTNSVAVTTGGVINPTLTATQDGANPLAYTVTADESATNIAADWSRVWSIDGNVVSGASTAKLSYTFDLTDHKYAVSYVASKEGYTDRTASIDVTTKGATKPTVTATASQDNSLSYAVTADLTNTGITAAWSYAWSSSPAASFKDATAATTDVEFASGGVPYTITFTATPPEGSTDVAQTGTTTVTTGQLAAKITSKQEKGLLYSFTADTSNTGLPKDGVTYAWSVNGNSIGTGSSVTYLFTKANTKYIVSLSTKVGDSVIGSNSLAVTTGDVINPSLTATQDGADPLAYTVTADESATNIGSDWSRVWSIDGEVVSGASTAKLSYTFGLTDHKYTVSYVASKEGYPDRTASIDVTTKAATKPTVTATPSQDNPLSYAVSADLTNTGITDAWSYAWSSTPEATFKDATVASTEVEFGKGGVYTISFTATPPEGSSDKAQKATEIITTMLPARITYKKVKGTKYEFSANTSGTRLPNEGVTYEWDLLNQWSLGTGPSIDFLFNSAHTKYRVELTTKVGNITIGTTQAYVHTGDALLPKVTASKDGSNPLVWTVKADVDGTNVNDDWTSQWYIDGKAVKGSTNTYTLDSYEFALTDHKYKVKFEATNTLPDGVTTNPVKRSATIEVITPVATAPKLSSSAGSSDLNFNVKADLTDTGITDAWSYQWSSTPEATFKDATAASTDVEFAKGGVAYTISFTATPPEDSSDKAQKVTETITTKMLPAQ